MLCRRCRADKDADDVSDQDEMNIYHSDPTSATPTGRTSIDGNEVNNEKSNRDQHRHRR